MGKVVSNILLFALAIALTIFTATRTLDLLAQWLPVNQQIMQWLGLAAFEGGLYFWAFYFVKGAKGSIQRGISIMMVVVSLASVAVASIADLVLVGAESGKLPDITGTQKESIVVFVGVIIMLNVTAFLAVKLTDPAKLKEMAIQDAEDNIYAEELAMIRRAAPHVAAHMAPIKTQQWVEETWQRMIPGVPTGHPDNFTIEGGINRYQLPSPREEQLSLAQTGKLQVPAEKSGGVLSGLKNLFSRANANQPHQTESEVKSQARQPRPFHPGQSTSGGAAAAGTAAAEDQMRATNPAAYDRYIKQQRTAARRARKSRQRTGNGS